MRLTDITHVQVLCDVFVEYQALLKKKICREKLTAQAYVITVLLERRGH